jgi:hypothetical protein
VMTMDKLLRRYFADYIVDSSSGRSIITLSVQTFKNWTTSVFIAGMVAMWFLMAVSYLIGRL